MSSMSLPPSPSSSPNLSPRRLSNASPLPASPRSPSTSGPALTGASPTGTLSSPARPEAPPGPALATQHSQEATQNANLSEPSEAPSIDASLILSDRPGPSHIPSSTVEAPKAPVPPLASTGPASHAVSLPQEAPSITPRLDDSPRELKVMTSPADYERIGKNFKPIKNASEQSQYKLIFPLLQAAPPREPSKVLGIAKDLCRLTECVHDGIQSRHLSPQSSPQNVLAHLKSTLSLDPKLLDGYAAYIPNMMRVLTAGVKPAAVPPSRSTGSAVSVPSPASVPSLTAVSASGPKAKAAAEISGLRLDLTCPGTLKPHNLTVAVDTYMARPHTATGMTAFESFRVDTAPLAARGGQAEIGGHQIIAKDSGYVTFADPAMVEQVFPEAVYGKLRGGCPSYGEIRGAVASYLQSHSEADLANDVMNVVRGGEGSPTAAILAATLGAAETLRNPSSLPMLMMYCELISAGKSTWAQGLGPQAEEGSRDKVEGKVAVLKYFGIEPGLSSHSNQAKLNELCESLTASGMEGGLIKQIEKASLKAGENGGEIPMTGGQTAELGGHKSNTGIANLVQLKEASLVNRWLKLKCEQDGSNTAALAANPGATINRLLNQLASG